MHQFIQFPQLFVVSITVTCIEVETICLNLHIHKQQTQGTNPGCLTSERMWACFKNILFTCALGSLHTLMCTNITNLLGVHILFHVYTRCQNMSLRKLMLIYIILHFVKEKNLKKINLGGLFFHVNYQFQMMPVRKTFLVSSIYPVS